MVIVMVNKTSLEICLLEIQVVQKLVNLLVLILRVQNLIVENSENRELFPLF